MPENTGLYRKYLVSRADGQPDRPGAAYWTIDVVNDPHARAALLAYLVSCRTNLPRLAAELSLLVMELDNGQPGPMVEALRTPRETHP